MSNSINQLFALIHLDQAHHLIQEVLANYALTH